MIQLMICDDHELIRTAVTRLLDGDGRFKVLAQVSSRAELFKALDAQSKDIDVLILDLNLGTQGASDSIGDIGELCKRYIGLRILVLSGHDDPETVRAAMTAGAFGFVTKGSPFDVLTQAVRHIHMGEHYLDPRKVLAVVNLDSALHAPAWDATLTQREHEVMRQLCKGQRVSDIARTLNLSIKTISTHKVRLMDKLDVTSNADLIKLGLRHSMG